MIGKTASGPERPWQEKIGRFGVWSSELRFGDPSTSSDVAAELEALGYGALWVPGGIGGDILERMDLLLDSTQRIVVASAIINVWMHEPQEVANWWAGQNEERRERLLLGLGISHALLIGDKYGKPLTAMRRYLDDLEELGVDTGYMCLAALGPKMLTLSAERTAGAHPYLVGPSHTREARDLIGPDALLAPSQAVSLETDPGTARATARNSLSIYLPLANYRNSWKRQGFTDDEIDGASDRLCDAMVAWGDIDRVAAQVRGQLDAGADHVAIKVVRDEEGGDPTALLPDWRRLASALIE